MKREDVFPRFDPPRAGLAGLRTRLEERPPRRWRVLVPVVAMAAALILLLLARRRSSPDLVAAAKESGGGAQIELGLAPRPTEAVVLDEGQRGTTALLHVPTSRPDVSLYLVSSIEWPSVTGKE